MKCPKERAESFYRSTYDFVYLNETSDNHRYNAKYLWQRIPSDMKATHEDLRRIWIVGQRMWQRNWPAVHAALNVEWGEDVKNIMTALKGKLIYKTIKD